MLLDYATQEPQRQDHSGDIRVAGLLDLASLLKYLDNPTSAKALSTIKSGTKTDPEQFYREHGLFIDPRNRLMKDTGSTYQGRELPQFNSLRALVEEGPTLEEYLQGTEAADVFGRDLRHVKVGATDLSGNMMAGYTAPQGFTMGDGTYRNLQDGFLVLNRSLDRAHRGPAFEHEMQHAYQNILGQPRGTTLDEMSDSMMDYLTEIGAIRPAQDARITAAARKQRASIPYMRYASTTGEAEARAAEVRHDARSQGYHVGIPQEGEYTWTHEGPTLSRSMLFDLPQDIQEGYSEWWRNKWK